MKTFQRRNMKEHLAKSIWKITLEILELIIELILQYLGL